MNQTRALRAQLKRVKAKLDKAQDQLKKKDTLLRKAEEEVDLLRKGAAAKEAARLLNEETLKQDEAWRTLQQKKEVHDKNCRMYEALLATEFAGAVVEAATGGGYLR